MTTTTSSDVINQLAGIADDSPLGQLRASRDVAFKAAQGSFQALLEPEEPGGVSRLEREAVDVGDLAAAILRRRAAEESGRNVSWIAPSGLDARAARRLVGEVDMDRGGLRRAGQAGARRPDIG